MNAKVYLANICERKEIGEMRLQSNANECADVVC